MPLPVSGATAHYDATVGVTDAGGGAVSQWNDQSGNGLHLTQAVADSRPKTGTRKQNGLNVIDFDGFDDHLLASVIGPTTYPMTFFLVAKCDTPGVGSTFQDPYAMGVNGPEARIRTGDGLWVLADLQTAFNLADADPHVYTHYHVTGGGACYQDRVLMGTTTNLGAGAINGPLCVGTQENDVVDRAWDGWIAELIIFNRVITDFERVAVEAYLQSKWVNPPAFGVSTLVEATRRHLLGQHRPQMNRLKTAISTVGQTTVTLEFDVEGVTKGAMIAVDDELMYVWSRDKGTKQAVVQRGVLGTSAATHAVGALIEVNPRYPTPIIRDELQREIRSWHPRLYAVVTKELTVGVSKRAVDLESVPGDFFHILEIRRQPRGTSDSWVRVRGRAEHNLNPSDFPSGSALFLDEPVEASTRIRVTYARPFNLAAFTDDIDLVTGALLEPSYFDIATYGAAWRLVSTREIKRTDSDAQGEPRDAAEVPPGHILQTARQLKALREERIAEEHRLLVHRWGVRK